MEFFKNKLKLIDAPRRVWYIIYIIWKTAEKRGKQVLKVKEMRKLLGLSQVAFSKKYSIPTRTIEQWEKDEEENNNKKKSQYVLKLLERVVVEDSKKGE